MKLHKPIVLNWIAFTCRFPIRLHVLVLGLTGSSDLIFMLKSYSMPLVHFY